MSIDFSNQAQIVNPSGMITSRQHAYVPKPIDMSFINSDVGKPAPDHINPDQALEEQKALQREQIELQKSQFAQSQAMQAQAAELSYRQYVLSWQASKKKGGGKVICTRMHELGFMSDEIFLADQRYGRKVYNKNPAFMTWYHKKADLFLKHMHGQTLPSRVLIRTMWLLINPWSKAMAYEEGIGTGSRLGRVLMRAGDFMYKLEKRWN